MILALALAATALVSQAGAAAAAEVLQVRGSGQLQIGDGNRSYTVGLACIQITPEQRPEAVAWLRQALPRRSKVNLRPFGSEAGTLMARVTRLPRERAGSDALDLGQGLLEAGLAERATGAGAMGCPELG
ncbi:hypothetical protein [Cyanobium sp. NIES-981]|uniref:hypothetical protein n=1 Tax=Cyanobium sp. NIES-981 TaxID=1851505 RepID=UPI0007DD9F63|nr:hypothetical protein [Cyanobium sp. NIES-981]SBO42546.1 conserved exported protein of unknown function [Cyanobium sp. NIES-981]